MTRSRSFLLVGLAILLLLLGVGGAAWWYLFGANAVTAAELVPGNTVAFATIPNAMEITAGYQASKLKQLVDSPNAKPLIDEIKKRIGDKNLDLIIAFAPNLSGQSFVAVTHFDYDQAAKIGLIAAMKPKAGMGDFNAFVEKLKATYADILKQGKTGTGNVAGVDYQWLQGPDGQDKICVAQVGGWIVTTWGEATLQDWLERFQKKSTTPSLAKNPDYQKSIERVGKKSMALTYFNYHALMEIAQKPIAKVDPARAAFLTKKFAAVGGLAIGTSFENGEIVDHFSFMMPRQAQLDAGMASAPNPFETLKFTGPDTRFYWGASVNWQQYWKSLQSQNGAAAQANPLAGSVLNFLQTWAQDAGVDVQHNMIDPLGPEFSFQVEWSADTLYPEAGLFVKLDKPDDFKPTVKAIIETVRKTYLNSAIITELNSDNRNFASLKFVTQPLPISPTITEDGPYLGIFLTKNQAVRSFSRDETAGLLHNAEFNRQIGDKRKDAAQIIFLDSPQLLDRGYRTALPYLSMAAMFNKTVATALQGHDLPPDLTWLAPMGTWSLVLTPDDDGMKATSASGIGNQGIFLATTLGGSVGMLQMMGIVPKGNASVQAPAVPAAPVIASPAPTPADATTTNDMTNAAPTTTAPPDTSTNTAPAPTPESAPATTSNSDANPSTPEQTKTP